MRERLIEGWLDKLNERGYQPVFCQALFARGHTVVHSTRHGPMEFGKDVISRDKDGNFHSFQLKGNPSRRLSISEWNSILPQIEALMRQPVEPPLSPDAVVSIPYLVTNGEVDEEVHAAIRALNSLAKSEDRPELQLISRGPLLADYILPIADTVWPASTEIDRQILKCWGLPGDDYFAVENFHHALLAALSFESPPKSRSTMDRHLYGAAIINEICMWKYVESENYVSTILGRTFFLSYIYSMIEKSNFNHEQFRWMIEITSKNIIDDFLLLIDELESKKSTYFYDKDVNIEFVYHKPRLMLLKAILAAFSIAIDIQPDLFGQLESKNDQIKEFIREFIDFSFVPHFLLGEFVIPQFLLIYWYACRNSGYGNTDYWISGVLRVLLEVNSKKDIATHIPNPYYLMPEILEENIEKVTLGRSDLKRRESFRNQLWCSVALFGLLVRRNLKDTAQRLFPELTRFIHRKTVVKEPWSFGLFRAENATDQGERLEFPASWAQYVERSKARCDIAIPKGLAEDPFTLSIFLILCPFRATEEVIYHLDDVYVGNWHSPKS